MLSALCARHTSKKIVQLSNVCSSSKVALRTSRFARTFSRITGGNLNGHEIQDKKEVNKDFKIIYKFPHIVLCRAICRLKLYQTAITLVSVPVVGYFNHVGIVGSEVLISTLAISGLAFCMLFVMGEIFRKTIGHIYYNSAKDLVKISHLTFWGGRSDIIVPTEDLVPFADVSENPEDFYVRVMRYSDPKKTLYLCLKFGGIKDFKSFTHVLGEWE